MTDDTRDRLIRLEAGQDELRRGQYEIREEIAGLKGEITGVKGEIAGVKGEITGIRGELASLKGEMAEVKSILAQLYPMMIRIDERLASVPSAADFHELRGRVEEISRRQPVTIGYTPPTGKAGTAG